jgi:hypothetical protein
MFVIVNKEMLSQNIIILNLSHFYSCGHVQFKEVWTWLSFFYIYIIGVCYILSLYIYIYIYFIGVCYILSLFLIK